MAKKRLIDAGGIVAVAEKAYDAWNVAMATADGKREINLVYKRQELCKAVRAVAEKCPTIDAVEVVRCRERAKNGLSTCPICFIEARTLRFINHDPDFYCGSGERKSDE